jgi:hypothetical protein
VALHGDEVMREFYTQTQDYFENPLDEERDFVCYLTDWIEVEV